MSNNSIPSTTTAELHTLSNTPSELSIVDGVTLSESQKQHVCLILDMFQAKGTMAKIEDGLIEEAVYEDMFASCKNRKEVAGQFLGLPLVTSSSKTLSHSVISNEPTQTTIGTGSSIPANEIKILFKHSFTFKGVPKEVVVDTTLVVFDSEEQGKIVRIQDRPMEEIPGNSLITMMRKFNAVAAPTFDVPKNEADDAKMFQKHQQ